MSWVSTKEMNLRKDTRIDLVAELQNIEPKSDLINLIIKEAQDGEFHDYKNRKYDCGKVTLVYLMSQDNRLNELRQAVMNGEYDETPDEEDKKELRQHAPESMWSVLGL